LEEHDKSKYMEFIVLVMSWVFEYCGTSNCQCDALKWFEEIQRDNEKVSEVLNIGKLKNYTGKDFSVESNQLKFAHYIVHALEYYVSQKSMVNFYKSVAQSFIDMPSGREECLDSFGYARSYFVKTLSVQYLWVAQMSLTAMSSELTVTKFNPFLMLFVLHTIEEVYRTQENLFELKMEEITPLASFAKDYLIKLKGQLFRETATGMLSILNIFLYQRIVQKKHETFDTRLANDYVRVAVTVLDEVSQNSRQSITEIARQNSEVTLGSEQNTRHGPTEATTPSSDLSNPNTVENYFAGPTLELPISKSGQSFEFKSNGVFTYRGTEINVFDIVGQKDPVKVAVRYIQLVSQLGLSDSQFTESLHSLPIEIDEWLQRTTGMCHSFTTTIDDFIL
jgi:hypothetical protein